MSESVAPAVLSVQGIHKSFGAQPVLRDVSLTLHEGDRLGLIGVNGSGKSTLLRIMAGLDHPDDGLVTRTQGLRIEILTQQVHQNPEETVGHVLDHAAASLRALIAEHQEVLHRLAEDLSDSERARLETRSAHLQHELELSGAWDIHQTIKKVAVALQLPGPDRILGTLSGGELRRVDLATKLIARPDVLLLDEPTNQIDTRSVEWIEHYLEGYPGSCILVTHDRYFLDRVVNRIVELAGNRVFSFPGQYEQFLDYKTRLLESEARAEAGRQTVLRRELEWLRRGPKARATKQKARIQRIEIMRDAEPVGEPLTPEFVIPEPRPLGKRILEVDQIARRYGDRILFKRFSLILQKGMRVGIVGPNGCGKTTLLRTLMGVEEPDEGKMIIGETVEYLYIDQERADVNPEESILQFVSNGALYWSVGERRVFVPAFLEGFLFDRASVRMPMRNLSGGECNRICLVRKLLRGGNVLVLDEPTNDLDLATLRVLEEAVLAFGGCAMIVSHDRYFLNRICTHMLVFEEDGKIMPIVGNYDDYLLYKERREEAERASATPVKTAPPRPRQERPQGLTYVEKRELEGMESAILEAESALEELHAQINAPGFYEQPHTRVQETLAAIEQTQKNIEALYARWSYLEERKG